MSFTRIILLFTLFIFPSFNFIGQQQTKVFYTNTLNHKKLTQKLTEGLESDSLKVKAIFDWITKHIDYDYRRYYNQNIKYYSPNKTLRKRKGVCTHYAELFDVMCQNAQIESMVIVGYGSKSAFYNGIAPYKSDHRWNAVKLSNGWQLVDATYGSGNASNLGIKRRKLLHFFFRVNKYKLKYSVSRIPNEEYCFVKADSLIKHSLPLTSNFQFLTPPINLNAWVAGQDSIQEYLETDFIRTTHTLENPIIESHTEHYLLKLGQRGLEYNSKNHFNVVRPASKIAFSMYEHYNKKLKKKASYETQVTYLDSISYYLKIIDDADNKFKSEAIKYNSQVNKYNNKRNKILYKSAIGKYGYYKARQKETKTQFKYFASKTARTENSMHYLYNKNINKTKHNIFDVKKSKQKQDSLQTALKYGLSKTKMDSINSLIIQNEDSLNAYIDSVKLGESLLKKQQSILNNLYKELLNTTIKGTYLNHLQKENNTLFIQNDTLHTIHLKLKAAHKTRDKIYSKKIKPYLSRVRTIVSRTSRLHDSAKRIIKRLKTSTHKDFNEDALYQEQNRKHAHSLRYLELSVVELSNISKLNSNYYKSEFKSLKVILKYLGKNLSIEKGRFHYIHDWHHKENVKIKKYTQQTLQSVNSMKKNVKARKTTLKNLIKEEAKLNK